MTALDDGLVPVRSPADRSDDGSGGSSGAPFLVYDHDGALPDRIREALAATVDGEDVVACTQPRELADLLTAGRYSVLVAGPGLDTRAGFERLRIIREELPVMAIVLVADDPSVEVRDVVRAGAVDLLTSTADPDQVRDALLRARALAERVDDTLLPVPAPAADPPAPETGPRVITIASASGGCGKTFLATNLAWFLATHGKRRVCIIDLDLQFGEVTASLRLRPRYTVADLLAHGDADRDLVDVFPEFCVAHESGIHVLAAPREPTEANLVRPEDVGRIIDAAKAHFDDVIVDTPPALADNVVVAYHRSDELLVMATLDIPSIRNLQVFLSTLERLHVPDDGIHLIVNKAERDAGVEVRQILKLFPRGFDATLPYAHEVQRSINAGRPVLDTSPAAPISRQMGDTMRRLLAEDQRQAFDTHRASTRSRRWWSRRKGATP